MSPIHELKVNKPFAWTEKADKAFEKNQEATLLPPAISFPDFSRLFTFTTDVSDVVCGAILMQESDNGKKNIIAVALHTFNPMEQNWSTTEQEAYAIKWAILKFDYFLCNRPFVIFTDYRSLTYLDQREFNNAKIRWWQEKISCYKFIFEFMEGKSNVWADMLRRSCGHKKVKTCRDPTPAGKPYKLEGSNLHIYIPSRLTVCGLSPELIHHRTLATTSESWRHYSHTTQPLPSPLRGFATTLVSQPSRWRMMPSRSS